jgi:hypothetical protein
MKRKSLGIGMLAMCVTIVYGQQTRYYEAVICGDALLHVEASFPENHIDEVTRKKIVDESERQINVSITTSTKDAASGRKQYDLVIDGKVFSVTLTNGIVATLSRDGTDMGIATPALDLRGKTDWIALSRHYHDEALKRLPFTRFLGLEGLANGGELSVLGRNVAPQTFEFVCGKSKRYRQIQHHAHGGIMRLYESVNDQYDAETGFVENFGSRAAGWRRVFSATLYEETGSLKFFSCNEFSAKFTKNGGLDSLTVFDSVTHKGIRERKWDAKGSLIHDRDLIQDPYPPFNTTNMVIRK